MGGLEADSASQVMTPSGIIPGLFACGELMGGVHGKNRLGGSSLLDCVVYGRVSGRSAAKFLMDRNIQSIRSGVVSTSGIAGNDEIVEIDWANKKVVIRSGSGSNSKPGNPPVLDAPK